VDAGIATAAEIARARPKAVLHIGIAGARRDREFPPAAIVIGSEARYSDLVIAPELAPSSVRPDPALLHAVERVMPEAHVLPIGTTARVGGSRDCDVEAMEGFAVLRAAALAGVPAVEVRVISNDIEEHDRTRWHFDHAFATVHAITPRLAAAIAQCVR
jgi:nucleoside phosphorylase